MTEMWPERALGEVVEFLDSQRRPITASERSPGPIPYYGANGVLDHVNGFLFDEPLVLLAEDGGHFDEPKRGIAYGIFGKSWVNNHAHVLRPRRGVDVRYLARALENYDARPFLTGSTRAKLTKGAASRMPLPVPPIEEQTRIAAVLDEVDDLRAKRQASLALLDSLHESIFLDMFGEPTQNRMGWARVALGDLLARIDSGKSPVCLSRPAGDDEWGVLKLGAVTWGEYDDREQKALPWNMAAETRYEVNAGDLLITRKNTRELVGACALVHQTRPRLLLSDLIFRLVPRPTAPLVPTYLHRLLSMPGKRREVQQLAGGSAGSMPNISKARLLDLPVELPPVEKQEGFASRVDGVRGVRRSTAASVAILSALFSCLQHRAFAGQL